MDKRYQVFISSTFADLEVERKGIMEAIIELDCFPAGMEMFPATDTEQFEYIKTIIDESDYYVLVVAGRYGSVAEDGISYTEKEFDYALEKGIPILAFIKKDIENIPVSKTDKDSIKRKKLDAFRLKALDGRMAKFWDNQEELKYNLHSSLSREFKMHPRTGWIRGDKEFSYENMERLNALQMENEKLKSFIEQMSLDEKIEIKENKIISKIESMFYINCYMDGKIIIDFKRISLREIIEKAGLLLKRGSWRDYFVNTVNRQVVNDGLIEFSELEITITDSSIDEIERKLYVFDIIEQTEDLDGTWLKFTNFGLKIFKEIIINS